MPQIRVFASRLIRPSHMTSFLIIVLAATTSTCGDQGDPLGIIDPEATVRISPQSLVVQDGDTAHFSATVYDKSGKLLDPLPAGMRVMWSSDNPQIASVSGEGLVRGLRPGQARVKAEFGSSNAWGGVSVEAVPSELLPAGEQTVHGTAGESIQDGLAVRVLDHRGEPVSGVDVTFEVISGGGRVHPAVVKTSISGAAITTLTLGPKVGLNRVVASAMDLEPITLTAIGAPDLKHAVLEVISGDGQEGTVGETLAAPLVVRMTDGRSNPVAGAVVRWAFARGSYRGEHMPPLVSVTDADGYSTVYWTLAEDAGPQTATARRWGGSKTKEWNANAKAGKVRAVTISPSGSQIEVGSEVILDAVATDRFGNALEGTAIFWDSSREDVATVDQSGRVRGIGPGKATISAFAGDVAGGAAVTVFSGALERVVLTPRNVTLNAGEVQSFSASAVMSDGEVVPVDVAYSSTGGTIDAEGTYTAGPKAGAFQVVGLHEASGRADTVSVLIVTDAPVLVAPADLTLVVGDVVPSSEQIEILASWSAVPNADHYGWRFQAQDGLVPGESGESSRANATVLARQIDADYIATVCVWAMSGALPGPESCDDIQVQALDAGAPVLSRIVISPKDVSLNSGEVTLFTAHGELTDGRTASVTVTFTATGGTITGSGLYTAGSSAGTFEVVASEPTSGLADTARVSVTALPSWKEVVIDPSSVGLTPGSSAQFVAYGRATDGSQFPVSATFTATGGSVSPSGLYTAGSSPGLFQVIATETATGEADTAQVTIQTPPPPGDYQTVLHEDWLDVSTQEELSAKGWFWQFGAGTDPTSSACNDAVLVTDPSFGKAVRIRLNPDDGPGCQRTVFTWHPFGAYEGAEKLPVVWFRFRIRFEPGWTTYHSDETNAASYKLSYIKFDGGPQSRIQYDWDAFHCPTPWGEPDAFDTSSGEWWNLGYRGSEWDDGEWYEFIQYVDVRDPAHVKTGWWRRRLTQYGAVNPGPWEHLTQRYDYRSDVRLMVGVGIGQNFNRPLDHPQFYYIGSVEAVDGSRHADPYGVAPHLFH